MPNHRPEQIRELGCRSFSTPLSGSEWAPPPTCGKHRPSWGRFASRQFQVRPRAHALDELAKVGHPFLEQLLTIKLTDQPDVTEGKVPADAEQQEFLPTPPILPVAFRATAHDEEASIDEAPRFNHVDSLVEGPAHNIAKPSTTLAPGPPRPPTRSRHYPRRDELSPTRVGCCCIGRSAESASICQSRLVERPEELRPASGANLC